MPYRAILIAALQAAGLTVPRSSSRSSGRSFLFAPSPSSSSRYGGRAAGSPPWPRLPP